MGYIATRNWISRHPLCARTIKCNLNYFRVKLALLFTDELPFCWIDRSKLVATKAHSSVTINAFAGLYEYAEMGFLLHYLRDRDIFLDVGANAGVYTILASKVIGCNTLSFEPVSSSFHAMARNIQLNDVSNLVDARQLAIGECQRDDVAITKTKHSCNHITEDCAESEAVEMVEMTTLDAICDGSGIVLKVDVEGFESHVLKGARSLFYQGRINAVIVEEAANVTRSESGFSIPTFMETMGFSNVSYDPALRCLVETLESRAVGRNRIYVRDFETAASRISSAPKRRIHPVSCTL